MPTCCRPCSRSSATAFYVGVYTIWLKRTSTQNIVIGGAAGAVPVLVGWAAVQNDLSWTPVVLFGVMFFWTPPHFWALAIRYADDYRAANVPMLPAVVPLEHAVRQMIGHTVAMVACSLLLVPVADLGPIYAVAAVVLGRDLHRRDGVAEPQCDPGQLDARVRVLDHVRHACCSGR